jgi:hypothetical protein
VSPGRGWVCVAARVVGPGWVVGRGHGVPAVVGGGVEPAGGAVVGPVGGGVWPAVVRDRVEGHQLSRPSRTAQEGTRPPVSVSAGWFTLG